MTENKRFRYNVNKNSIEYDNKHFAYCNSQQGKIANKLNELNDENKELKSLCKILITYIEEMSIEFVIDKDIKVILNDYISM